MSFPLQPSRRLCLALVVGLALPAGVLGLASNAAADLSPDVYDYTVADRLPVVLNGIPSEPNNWEYVHRLDSNPADGVGTDKVAVTLDACRTTFARFQWVIDGAPGAETSSCNSTIDTEANVHHTVVLNAAAATEPLTQKRVDDLFVNDYLVAGIGDSAAAGEGNPERGQTLRCAFGSCVVDAGPLWADGPGARACHRSTKAGVAQAAISLERLSSRTAVTFLHLACSGAEVESGLLGPYAGIEPDSPPTLMPPQIDQLDSLTCANKVPLGASCPTGVPHRRIDALVISIGINDVHFSDVLSKCWMGLCPSASSITNDLDTLFNPALPDSSTGLLKLRQAIVDHHLNVGRIYLTEYPNPTRNPSGGFTDLPGILGGVPGLFPGIRVGSLMFMESTLLIPLNDRLRTFASQAGWTFVGGIASQFLAHGYAADACPFSKNENDVRGSGCGAPDPPNRWVRTFEDARWLQGPWCSPYCSPHVPTGTFHPNAAGHRAIAGRIIDTIVDPTKASFSVVPGSGVVTVQAGQPFQFRPTIRNTGNGDATDIRGFVLPAEPLVQLTDPHSSFPNLAGGATATGTAISGTLSPAAECGRAVKLNLAVRADAGNRFERPVGSGLVTLRVGTPGLASAAASADVPKAIPHGFLNPLTNKLLAKTVTSTVSVPTPGLVYDVRLTIGDLRVPYVNALSVVLVSPDGHAAQVFGGANNGGANFLGTTFADDSNALDITAQGTAPYTGIFKPAESFDVFDGTQAQGVWSLRITNSSDEDSATLNSWGASIRPAVCTH